MKTLILDGSTEQNSEIIKLNSLVQENLKKINSKITYIPLIEEHIAPCQGCFDCWLKTPGVCRIEDFGREITKLMVQNDLIMFITPITFGGYSSELKKAVDRFIPNILPFFKKVNGEIHHKQRYEKIASKIFIGYLNNPDKEKENIFKELTYRNSLNMEGRVFQTLIYIQSQGISEFENRLQDILLEVKIPS